MPAFLLLFGCGAALRGGRSLLLALNEGGRGAALFGGGAAIVEAGPLNRPGCATAIMDGPLASNRPPPPRIMGTGAALRGGPPPDWPKELALDVFAVLPALNDELCRMGPLNAPYPPGTGAALRGGPPRGPPPPGTGAAFLGGPPPGTGAAFLGGTGADLRGGPPYDILCATHCTTHWALTESRNSEKCGRFHPSNKWPKRR